jgi:hypothetical protein
MCGSIAFGAVACPGRAKIDRTMPAQEVPGPVSRAQYLLVLALCALGCSNLDGNAGEQGRLHFSLGSEFRSSESDLDGASIVAGHTQRVAVELTAKGEDDIQEPNEVQYRLIPHQGTTVRALPGTTYEAPTLEVLVTKEGRYRLEAIYKGKIVDSAELTFDTPDALQITVRTRGPYEQAFVTAAASDTSLEVEEGSEVAFAVTPLKGAIRLLGHVEARVSATPRALVVPGMEASWLAEQDAWSVEGQVTFYFIDPGSVNITLSDPISGASGSYAFVISAAP